ncbi:hypothetical protein ScPMuIL_009390 [Solemya velum]
MSLVRLLVPVWWQHHIHMSLKKGEEFIDPTRFLESRLPQMPVWLQECDDYKLVYKFETIAVGSIAGLAGRKANNTSPIVENSDVQKPEAVDATRKPGKEVQEMKEDSGSLFSKIKSKPLPEDFDDEPDDTQGGSSGNTGTKKKKKNGLGSLMSKPKNFLKKFSIRSLKLGAIIEFMDFLGLDESKVKMANVMKTVKKIIDNKPCYNPRQMTDETLRTTLKERGMNASGTTDQMINRLLQADNQCPFLSFTMPKNMYCTFDSMCLGVECCFNMKIFMFLKTFKAYVRFDPCDLEFHIGFHTWKKTISLGISYNGFEDEIATGITLDLLGGVELILRYSIEKTDMETVATFQAGFCNIDDKTNCLPFSTWWTRLCCHYLSAIPTDQWSGPMVSLLVTMNFAEYFSKENVAKRLKEAGKKVMKEAGKLALTEILKELGLPEDILDPTPPCPRPENMTATALQAAMEERGLLMTGGRSDWETRYRQDDLTCTVLGKTVVLPDITNAKLRKHLYYYIADDCLRIDSCVDFTIARLDYTKALRAYIDLDPCELLLTVAFEKWSKTFILINYDWGAEKVVPVNDNIEIRFALDRDVDLKIYLVDFWLKLCLSGSECVVDVQLFNKQEIPMPLCNENFTMPGGSIAGLASALGGALTSQAFDLILQQVGLDKFLLDEPCKVDPPQEACPWNLTLVERLPAKLQKSVMCELAENCYGVRCCVSVDFKIPFSEERIEKSIPIMFEIRPCDFQIEIGLGLVAHTKELLSYDWGSPNVLRLGSGNPAPVNIKYSIDRTGDDKGFLVDLNVGICLPIDDDPFCIPEDGVNLLEQEEIRVCDAREVIKFKDFSFKTWMKNKGLEAKETLKSAGVKLLLEQLGMTEYLLDTPCNAKHEPYSPNVAGVNNKCPLSFLKLPNLPKMVSCHIPKKCTAINCCMSVDFLGLSFNAFIDIDTCNYKLSGCVEKICFNITLFEYDWGKQEQITIQDVVRLDFSIDNPTDKKVFVIDLTISLCMEHSQPCMFTIPVFKGTEVPQPICDLSATIGLSNFSVSTWADQLNLKNLDLTKSLSKYVVRLLLEQLGVAEYLKSPACDRTREPYKLAENNWKSDCPKDVPVPDLTGPLTCHIPDYCTGIDCCLDITFLDMSLNAYLFIDSCNAVLSGGIENLKFSHNILKYEWGKILNKEIKPLKNKLFRIQDLSGTKQLLVDLSFAICLESGADCQFEVVLFNQTKIPKPFCDWSTGFSIKDFNLEDWVKEKGLKVGDRLVGATVDILLEELGIAVYMPETPCDRTSATYSPQTSTGWKDGCGVPFDLPALTGPVSGYISDTCTAVGVCIDVDFIKRSFNVDIELDGCNYILKLFIGKKMFPVSLISYDWGAPEQIQLFGVVVIDFTIEDLKGDKMFLVNMNVKLCFNADSCDFDFSVMVDTLLPKPACNFNTSLDFSLKAWLKEEGLGALTGYATDMLLEMLGVTQYLMPTPCDRQSSLYNPNVGGWNKDDCRFSFATPTLPDVMSCHVMSVCTGVECCMDLDLIQKSIQASILLDACNYKMKVAIEKLEFEMPFFDYNWGERKRFSLKDVFYIEYSIKNLDSTDEFFVDLDLSICFERDSCLEPIHIFRDSLLPKPGCNFELSNPLADFSFSDWKNKHNIVDTLGNIAVAKLLEALGVSAYLLSSPCDRQTGIYVPSEKGWNKDACGVELTLPDLSGPMTCHVPDYCTGVDCCVDIEVIHRSFHVALLLDACNYKFTISIEKQEIVVYLFTYNWGVTKHFWLKGVVRIDYTIHDLPEDKVFVVDMVLNVCLDKDECIINQTVLNGIRFPKPLCNYNAIGDFSLTSWLEEQKLTAGGQLGSLVVTQLMEASGLAPYLNPGCQRRSDPKYFPAEKGWNKKCKLETDLRALNDSLLTCHIPSYCTGIDCCVDVPFTGRAFNAYILIDACENHLQVGIEKLKIDRSLVGYTWVQTNTSSLIELHVLRCELSSSFSIENLNETNQFRVNMALSVCFNDECENTFAIFENSLLPKTLCDLGSGFTIPDFSLSDWLIEKGSAGISQLTKELAAQLFETLGITPFLQETPCSFSEEPFSQAQNGWYSECPEFIELRDFDDPVACHVPRYCTGLDCCTQVEMVQRAFHTYVLIDSCNYKITIAVENLMFEIKLFEYDFGETQSYYLHGVVRLDFTILDLKEDNMYSVNLTLRVCLSEDGACLVDVKLLEETLLPKLFCGSGTNWAISDFSLTQWLIQRGEKVGQTLTSDMTSILLRELGVDDYLLAPSCDPTDSPYLSGPGAWTSSCGLDISLPDLIDPVACHFGNSCLSLECCLSVDLIQKSFRFSIELDACSFKLLIEIENLKTEILLFDYEWGTPQVFRLQGALQIHYRIDDLKGKKMFLLSVGLSVCFDTSGSCMLEVAILTNYELPKPLCNWSSGFNIQGTEIVIDRLLEIVDTLTTALTDKLIKDLGIKEYLEKEQCQHSATPYLGSENGWKNDCPRVFDPAPLDESVVCHISTTCTNIHCCLDAGRIPLRFHVYIDLDADNYKLTVGIERLHFQIMLLDYDWGVVREFWLSGLIRVQYSIEDLRGQRAFAVNMDLSVCYSIVDCPHNFNVFTNMLLLKPTINLGENFSLTAWVEEKGQTIEDGFADYMVDLLLEKVGIAPYLSDPSCSISRVPYILAGRDGWAHECPELNLPDLSDPVVCHMMDTCSGVECCLSLGLIDRSLSVFVILDFCDSKLKIGIEQFKFELDLNKYILGTKETFKLGNVVFIDYSIFNLEVDQVFLVDVTVRVCLEVDSCVINETILENARLKKPFCDWASGFISEDFSLSSWVQEQALVSGGVLSSYFTAKLMEELGIGHYLVNPPCDRSMAPYDSPINGWTTDCPGVDLASLPVLPSTVTCHLQDSCTAIDCCMQPPLIGRSFKAELSLDTCDYELVVRIENREVQFPLFEFPWGEERSMQLNGFLVFNYTVGNLQGMFLVTARLAVCQSGDSCDLVTLLENTKLPKPICNYAVTDFQIPDFSLTSWVAQRGLGSVDQLAGHYLSVLLEELGLPKYLKQQECNRNRSPYVPQKKGWNKKCSKSIELPTLEGAYGCAISDSCTGVDCCLEAETIDRSFNVFLSIDGCNNKFSVGIEKLTFEKMLINYNWGVTEKIYLKNVVRLEFSILNLEGQDSYLVNMDLKICFGEEPCILTFPVFNNTLLPKPLCGQTLGFLNPDFNLEVWMGQITPDWTVGSPLSATVVSQLLNALGVAQYISEDGCVHVEGGDWDNGCSRTVEDIPTLPSAVSCSLHESCTSFDCCMSIEQLQRTFSVSVDVDSCNYKMVINIEKLKFEVLLFNFDWGELKHYWMYGFIRIDLKLVDLVGRQMFLLDLDLRVCMNGDEGDCAFSSKVFNNTQVSKRACDWVTGYLDDEFSFGDWLENAQVDLDPGEALDMVLGTQLLATLGIDNFMSGTPCRRNVAPYGLATDGWTRDCLQEVKVPPLYDPITCVLSTSCTGVDCCVDIDVLGKAINTFVDLDACAYTMDIGIEKLKFRTSLLGYKWGEMKQIDLFGVFRINFQIDDLPTEKKYLMNMVISVCLEDSPDCELELDVMKNVEVPKPPCDWRKDFLLPGFSLSSWVTEQGYEQRDQLADFVTAHLLEVTGVAEYLVDTPCIIGQGHYTSETAPGWTNNCTETIDVSALPHSDTVSCYIGDTCTAVDCCVYIEKIDRSVSAVLNLDGCNYRLEIGIEKLKFTVSLLDFSFGEHKQFWLNGVIRLDFTIGDLSGEGEFLVSLSIAVCFGEGDCVIEEPILTNTKLPKPICNWNTSFLVEDFSLSSWVAGKDIGGVLPGYVVSQLMETLGISEYLEDPSCDRQTDKYFKSSLNGWTSDCPMNITSRLPAIGDDIPVTCHLSELCTGVRCCVDAPDIGKSFTAFVEVDASEIKLRVGIERLQFTKTLFNYSWGSRGTVLLVWSAESRGSLCSPGSPAKKWTCLKEEFLDTPHVWQLLNDLGIAAYLDEEPCNRNSGIYVSPTNGWKKDCNSTVDVPDLGGSSLTCVLGLDCTSVDCCVDVGIIRKSFHTILAIDPCSLILTVGIEKLVFNIPLFDYVWGQDKRESHLCLYLKGQDNTESHLCLYLRGQDKKESHLFLYLRGQDNTESHLCLYLEVRTTQKVIYVYILAVRTTQKVIYVYILAVRTTQKVIYVYILEVRTTQKVIYVYILEVRTTQKVIYVYILEVRTTQKVIYVYILAVRTTQKVIYVYILEVRTTQKVIYVYILEVRTTQKVIYVYILEVGTTQKVIYVYILEVRTTQKVIYVYILAVRTTQKVIYVYILEVRTTQKVIYVYILEVRTTQKVIYVYILAVRTTQKVIYVYILEVRTTQKVIYVYILEVRTTQKVIYVYILEVRTTQKVIYVYILEVRTTQKVIYVYILEIRTTQKVIYVYILEVRTTQKVIYVYILEVRTTQKVIYVYILEVRTTQKVIYVYILEVRTTQKVIYVYILEVRTTQKVIYVYILEVRTTQKVIYVYILEVRTTQKVIYVYILEVRTTQKVIYVYIIKIRTTQKVIYVYILEVRTTQKVIYVYILEVRTTQKVIYVYILEVGTTQKVIYVYILEVRTTQKVIYVCVDLTCSLD